MANPIRNVDKTAFLIMATLFAPLFAGVVGFLAVDEAKRQPGIGTLIGLGTGVVLAAVAVGFLAQIKVDEDPIDREPEPAPDPWQNPVPKPVPKPVAPKPDPNADLKRERAARLKDLREAAADPDNPLDPITVGAQEREIEADYQRKLAERKS